VRYTQPGSGTEDARCVGGGDQTSGTSYGLCVSEEGGVCVSGGVEVVGGGGETEWCE